MIRALGSISRLHIAAIGAMGTLTFAWALCGVRAAGLALVSGTDWFVVNLLNRVVDLREDEANAIPGTALVARHRRWFLAFGVATLVASLALTAVHAPALLPFRLAFHALGFAYNWPLLPGRRRIKELALWKNVASATGFLLTVFAYPLAALPLRPDVGGALVAWAALFFFLFELSYEVLYDLRDVEGDRLAGVRTWPVLLGPAGGWRVAAGLMLASAGVAALGYGAAALPWRIAVMGVAPLLQLVVAAQMVRRGVTARDCIGLTWMGVVLLGGYHVWELLGLPGAG